MNMIKNVRGILIFFVSLTMLGCSNDDNSTGTEGTPVESQQFSLLEDGKKVLFFPKDSKNALLLFNFGLPVGKAIECTSLHSEGS